MALSNKGRFIMLSLDFCSLEGAVRRGAAVVDIVPMIENSSFGFRI